MVFDFCLKKELKCIRLKLLGLGWGFHETWWFFEVFEIPRTGSSFDLFFQLTEPSGSLILNLFSNIETRWVLHKSNTQPTLVNSSCDLVMGI
jgi:hypothetical protein